MAPSHFPIPSDILVFLTTSKLRFCVTLQNVQLQLLEVRLMWTGLIEKQVLAGADPPFLRGEMGGGSSMSNISLHLCTKITEETFTFRSTFSTFYFSIILAEYFPLVLAGLC